jgi:hypothetical protein
MLEDWLLGYYLNYVMTTSFQIFFNSSFISDAYRHHHGRKINNRKRFNFLSSIFEILQLSPKTLATFARTASPTCNLIPGIFSFVARQRFGDLAMQNEM